MTGTRRRNSKSRLRGGRKRLQQKGDTMSTHDSTNTVQRQEGIVSELTGRTTPEQDAWEKTCAETMIALRANPASCLYGLDPARILKGLELAQHHAVRLAEEDDEDIATTVLSGKTTYVVRDNTCSCRDWEMKHEPCKHLIAEAIHCTALGHKEPEERERMPETHYSDTNGYTTNGTTEALASFNIKYHGKTYELMYTARGATDQEIIARIPTFPNWVRLLLQQAAKDIQAAHTTPEPPPPPPPPQISDQIAAGIAAYFEQQQARDSAATTAKTVTEAQSHAETMPEEQQRDSSWCTVHNTQMTWHAANAIGPGWYSHGDRASGFCKGR